MEIALFRIEQRQHSQATLRHHTYSSSLGVCDSPSFRNASVSCLICRTRALYSMEFSRRRASCSHSARMCARRARSSTPFTVDCVPLLEGPGMMGDSHVHRVETVILAGTPGIARGQRVSSADEVGGLA